MLSLNDQLASQYSQLNQPATVPLANIPKAQSPVPSEAKSKASTKRPVVVKVEDVETPSLKFHDMGGIDAVMQELRELIERPLRFPQVYARLGLDLPRGILLHGPPGCGKTMLASAIAGQYGLPLVKASAPELLAGMGGESERAIRELFATASRHAPCILFIDDIDVLAAKRGDSARDSERRIVSQLASCLDNLSIIPSASSSNSPSSSASSSLISSSSASSAPLVFVLAATSKPDALDASLRRAGRFDRELRMGIPDEQSRSKILAVIARSLTLDPAVNFDTLARLTPGFVGADLRALLREAANVALARIFAVLDVTMEASQLIDSINVSIGMHDLLEAIKKVQPSAKREGFAVCPNVTWEDVGALHGVRQELRLAVVEPMRRPELYAALGVTRPCGVLLYGPPGCGKTLLAKAVANESHSNFLSVKGPELLNKFVGESERAIRQLFARARAAAPCVVFFDEIDALCPPRSAESDYASRIVNQLLTELDGLEGRQGVYVLAATNRPDMIDVAMTRPGRLDRHLYVGLPSVEERWEILQTIGRRVPWSGEVDFRAIANATEGFSGADLDSLVREAAFSAIREIIELDDPMAIDDRPVVRRRHVDLALTKIRPSVSSPK